jgi:hypothetical protein
VRIVLTCSNNQSLAAKPPTRITCCERNCKMKIITNESHPPKFYHVLIASGPLSPGQYSQQRAERILQHLFCAWVRIPLINQRSNLPSKFQLTEPNTTIRIVVSRQPKLDILLFFGTAEPWFRSLVETIRNMIEVLCKRRFIE